MAALDAGVPLRDVQLAARHADPRTTTIYDRRRQNFDRHAAYVVVAYVAGGGEHWSTPPTRTCELAARQPAPRGDAPRYARAFGDTPAAQLRLRISSTRVASALLRRCGFDVGTESSHPWLVMVTGEPGSGKTVWRHRRRSNRSDRAHVRERGG